MERRDTITVEFRTLEGPSMPEVDTPVFSGGAIVWLKITGFGLGEQLPVEGDQYSFTDPDTGRELSGTVREVTTDWPAQGSSPTFRARIDLPHVHEFEGEQTVKRDDGFVVLSEWCEICGHQRNTTISGPF